MFPATPALVVKLFIDAKISCFNLCSPLLFNSVILHLFEDNVSVKNIIILYVNEERKESKWIKLNLELNRMFNLQDFYEVSFLLLSCI